MIRNPAPHGCFDVVGTQIVFSLTAVVLNLTLYRARLVPRFISVWGFTGGILILITGIFSLLGLIRPFSPSAITLYIPIAFQEMFFAAWLIIKGFSLPVSTVNTNTRNRR